MHFNIGAIFFYFFPQLSQNPSMRKTGKNVKLITWVKAPA